MKPCIENWFVTKSSSNPYKAPELWTWKLSGEVYGREGFKEGEKITTSALTALDAIARTAKTYSGTEYDLGEPDADWLAWLIAEGYKLSDFSRK
jgi:hypothetical protein